MGFTGLGNALAMLNLRYDAPEGREMAARIARCMRDAAYAASVELAKEKGAFALFDADAYLEAGTFASRLDEPLKQAIREHGIRNSHLLSIAPTGTVSLAFADNASNGIEPPFSWTYRRKKREGDGSRSEYDVEDHAWRLYRSLGGDTAQLPPSLRLGAGDAGSRPPGDDGGGAALRRHSHFENGECPRGLCLRRLQGSLPARPGARA